MYSRYFKFPFCGLITCKLRYKTSLTMEMERRSGCIKGEFGDVRRQDTVTGCPMNF